MKYEGRVISNGLIGRAFSNFIKVTKKEKKDGEDLVYFEVEPELALAVAEEISECLQPSKYSAIIKNDFRIHIIFPNKVFSFDNNDQDTFDKAVEYGKDLEIKKQDLIWNNG